MNGGDWSSARIIDIAATQTIHVADRNADRIRMSGSSDVILKATAAEALGLAIHELATNAAKYGALRAPDGYVEVEWSLSGDDGGEVLEIAWSERGGPKVKTPTRTGFGSLLIKRNMEQAFGAPVSMDWAPEGLEWRIVAPAERVISELIEAIDTHGAFGPFVVAAPLAH